MSYVGHTPCVVDYKIYFSQVWDQDLSVSYCFIYNNADQTNAVVWDENGTVIYG